MAQVPFHIADAEGYGPLGHGSTTAQLIGTSLDLVDHCWIDAINAAQLIQDTVVRAQGALAKLSRSTIHGSGLVVPLDGVPDTAEPVWVLSAPAKTALSRLDHEVGQARRTLSRDSLAADYVSQRGRISSTELGGLVGADPTNLGPVLRRLEDEGLVAPAWPSRQGKGFHYVFVGRDERAR